MKRALSIVFVATVVLLAAGAARLRRPHAPGAKRRVGLRRSTQGATPNMPAATPRQPAP